MRPNSPVQDSGRSGGDVSAIYWGTSNPQTEAHARTLGAELHFVHFLGWKKGPLVAAAKYGPQFLSTLWILLRDRPRVVYVAISPVFAALSVYVYTVLSRTTFVMDVHGHALHGRSWGWSVPLVRWLARRSLTNIVDQPMNEEMFESWGAPVMRLERPPITFDDDSLEDVSEGEEFPISVINTFAADEPIEPLLGAARLRPNVTFYIMGDVAQADADLLATAPSNVVFTGYLNGSDFWNRLYSSRAIVALTTEDYSLLSAAIEAMAMNKPSILSRRRALTDYFTKGAVFVEHTPEGISAGIDEIRNNEVAYIQEAAELNREKQQRWRSVAAELVEVVAGA